MLDKLFAAFTAMLGALGWYSVFNLGKLIEEATDALSHVMVMSNSIPPIPQ